MEENPLGTAGQLDHIFYKMGKKYSFRGDALIMMSSDAGRWNIKRMADLSEVVASLSMCSQSMVRVETRLLLSFFFFL